MKTGAPSERHDRLRRAVAAGSTIGPCDEVGRGQQRAAEQHRGRRDDAVIARAERQPYRRAA